MEWQRYRDSLCGGCGHEVDRVFDPDLEGAFDAHVLQCQACAARETAMKANSEQPGIKVGVQLSPEAERFLRERDG